MSVSLKEKEELIKELYNITNETKQKLDDVLSKMLKKINTFLSDVEERQFSENVEKSNNFYNSYIVRDIVRDKEFQDDDDDCCCACENCICDELNNKKKELEIITETKIQLDKKLDELVEEDFQLSKIKKERKKELKQLDLELTKSKEEKKQQTKDRAKEKVHCEKCDISVRLDGLSRHNKSKSHLKNV